MKRYIAILFTLLLAPSIAFAETVNELGEPEGYVNDYGNMLSSGFEEMLEQNIAEYERSTTNEIAVVTVKNLGGINEETFAKQLWSKSGWELGKKGVDNGVLLLISKEDRVMRMQLGAGINEWLDESDAKYIIDYIIIPEFKLEKYETGILEGVEEIKEELGLSSPQARRELEAKQLEEKRLQAIRFKAFITKVFSFIFYVIIGILILYVLRLSIKHFLKTQEYRNLKSDIKKNKIDIPRWIEQIRSVKEKTQYFDKELDSRIKDIEKLNNVIEERLFEISNLKDLNYRISEAQKLNEELNNIEKEIGLLDKEYIEREEKILEEYKKKKEDLPNLKKKLKLENDNLQILLNNFNI